MPEIDVVQMKTDLTAMKAKQQEQKADPAGTFSSAKETTGPSIGARREALQRLVVDDQHLAPVYEYVDTPFMIWALRNHSQGTNIMTDSHYEPMNNWAKLHSSLNEPDDFLTTDELSFYFYWSNDTGADAVVNVSSYLMLNGSCTINAFSGFIWSPFEGTGTIGTSTLTLNAQLTLLEWWNQPPTHPSRQAGQDRDIIQVSKEGTWAPITISPAEFVTTSISDNYHLNHDMFRVPRGGVAVFEVTLHATYEVYNGYAGLNFAGDEDVILCPYLRVEIQ